MGYLRLFYGQDRPWSGGAAPRPGRSMHWCGASPLPRASPLRMWPVGGQSRPKTGQITHNRRCMVRHHRHPSGLVSSSPCLTYCATLTVPEDSADRAVTMRGNNEGDDDGEPYRICRNPRNWPERLMDQQYGRPYSLGTASATCVCVLRHRFCVPHSLRPASSSSSLLRKAFRCIMRSNGRPSYMMSGTAFSQIN